MTRALSTYKIAFANEQEFETAEDVIARFGRLRASDRRLCRQLVLSVCAIAIVVAIAIAVARPNLILWLAMSVISLCSVDWVDYAILRRSLDRQVDIYRVLAKHDCMSDQYVRMPSLSGVLHYGANEPCLRIIFSILLLAFGLSNIAPHGPWATAGIAMSALGIVVVVALLGFVRLWWIRFILQIRLTNGYCLECGYDLRGLLASGACPECGCRIKR
jgi:hypothetical protein